MSDVEQRLQAAGAAWRAEQQQPQPRRAEQGRRSRWLPAAAAVAVVALALAAATLGGTARPPTPAGPADGSWAAMAASPLSPRLRPVMAGWGDRVVVLGGDPYTRPCPPNASCVRDLREAPRDGALYDVPADRWERLPDAPLPLDVMSSAVLDDVLYLWLGSADVLALNLVERSWTQLPDPPGGSCCARLTAAGDRLVAYYAESGRSDAGDLAWVPAARSWQQLPRSPLDTAYDRTMVWTGEALVLVTPGAPPGQERSGPPYLRAAVLRGGVWELLPAQEVVIGGSLEWWWTGDRVVSAATYEADGGQVHGFGRSIPSGGYLDLATGRWSALPEPPSEQERSGRAPGPLAAGGRYVANGEGLVLDTTQERWIVLPPYEDQPDQDAAAAWAAGRLVVWGGAAGVRPAPEPAAARPLGSGAVWTPPAG